jgi:hypothetical protein
MADFTATVAALRSILAGYSALPIFWPNSTAQPSRRSAPDGFVIPHASIVAEKQATLGPPGVGVQRDYGVFHANVYTWRGQMVGGAEEHATAIRALFPRRLSDDIVITSKRIGNGVAVDGPSGHAYCIPVTIEFFADRVDNG